MPHEIKEVINVVKKKKKISGKFTKIVSQSEIIEKNWRADPTDGLRPLKKYRK